MNALDVLDDVPQWQLTPSEWARVEEALYELEAAIEEGDTARVQRAAKLVGLCGPIRVSRSLCPQPDEPEPAPPSALEVLEVINRIVHNIAPDEESPHPNDEH